MAVALVIDLKGTTSGQYDAVMADLNMSADPPPGILHHVAGPMNGGWRVVDIWESEAQFNNFIQSRLGAAMAKHGVAPPVVTAFPVHNIWQPPA